MHTAGQPMSCWSTAGSCCSSPGTAGRLECRCNRTDLSGPWLAVWLCTACGTACACCMVVALTIVLLRLSTLASWDTSQRRYIPATSTGGSSNHNLLQAMQVLCSPAGSCCTWTPCALCRPKGRDRAEHMCFAQCTPPTRAPGQRGIADLQPTHCNASSWLSVCTPR